MDRKRRNLSREWIGAALLVVLLIGGVVTSLLMTRSHEAMAKTMEDAAWAALSQNWSGAVEMVKAGEKDWQSRWNLEAMVVDHRPMEEIDALFRQLEVHGALRETGEFAAACQTLSARLRAIGNAQRLSWWNLM